MQGIASVYLQIPSDTFRYLLFLQQLNFCHSRVYRGRPEKYINIPSEKYIYVHIHVYICVYTYLCKMDEYRSYGGLPYKLDEYRSYAALPYKLDEYRSYAGLPYKLDEYRSYAGLPYKLDEYRSYAGLQKNG